ncbi:MAG: ABC transporter ATP-binding protein [Pontibacterium sp.]
MKNPVSEVILSVQDVAKSFNTQAGTLSLFTNINLKIAQGESVAIIGPSGAGKSTLLSLLAGLDLPSQGSVRLKGLATDQLDEKARAQLRSQHISFVFQTFHLLPELSALENVILPLEIRGTPHAPENAKNWLAQVGLSERLNHHPAELSGGEQQRVAIARAFATEPDLLFADEPTGNLDEQTGETIIKQLFELNKKQHTTLILITHDNHLAARCDRCLQLSNGELLELTL